MTQATGEKKPAQGGFAMGDEVEVTEPWVPLYLRAEKAGLKRPEISPEMASAGLNVVSGLDLYDAETLVEEVYIAMEQARQLALRPS